MQTSNTYYMRVFVNTLRNCNAIRLLDVSFALSALLGLNLNTFHANKCAVKSFESFFFVSVWLFVTSARRVSRSASSI
jgi:hypothetical protein